MLDFLEHPTPRELAPVVAAATVWAGVEPWQQLSWSSSEDGAGRDVTSA
jgi:hypothetical protein